MVWAGVASTGEKTPLFFIEEGVKVNQHVYVELLRNKLVPWVNTTLEKAESLSSRMEPHPTAPILSRNGVRGIWWVFG